MKKLFVLITVLISLSLLGIILFQVSWLKNMVKLKEDQVKERIDKVTSILQTELTAYKAQFLTPSNDIFGIMPPLRSLTESSREKTIDARLSLAELNDRIHAAFKSVGLEEIKYEFGLMVKTFGQFDQVEKQSMYFERESHDTIRNYQPPMAAIFASNGSTIESPPDEYLIIIALNFKQYVMRSITGSILLAVLFTLVIIAAFFLTVYTMLRQKKLGEIKNDFINNMTHEFKTPIATISLAVDALKNEKVLSDRTKLSYFSGIIKEENQRMNKQVEAILKASQFEKQEVDLEKEPLHIHEIIQLVADKFLLQLQEKNGRAELNLEAVKDEIVADEVHFTNLVNNLIDNAVKYSKEHVPIHLKIASYNQGNKLVLRFEDNGIGMGKETQKRVFEKFYRAHTGNLHNVKGFGLGLNYVKSVTQSHHGTINLESSLGKGSVFTLEFPLAGNQPTT